MQAFQSLTAVAAPLMRANIDTDAIIPSREMKTVSKTGLAAGLFAGWRYRAIGSRELNPEFVFNQGAYADARIIVAGENFGCGSSREHAVWALYEFGIRAIIAPSFAPIFASNCVRNGIVPVKLPAAQVAALAASVTADPAGNPLSVDLQNGTVRLPDGQSYSFDMDPESREMLLQGLDAIDLSLKQRPAYEAWLSRDRQLRPWIYL